MRYQLVLQFRESALDFDAMVGLEQDVAVELGPIVDVDGHDRGSGEVNIFIYTDDFATAFERIRLVLEDRRLLGAVTAAYRDDGGDRVTYTVIWPAGSTKPFKLI